MTKPALQRPLKLGTRRSPLAIAQAEEARARLIAAHGLAEADVELVTVTASGDRIQDRPLAEIGGKALWTKELDAWLLEGEIDFAVHSAKDVETIRPDCTVVPIRGNVATRLAKLAAGEADATFLAAAGLNRLGETGTGHPLPVDEWLPAPGQAAIAIECRAHDEATRTLLSAIDHAPSRTAVLAERALLAALGGGCHSAIAVLTTLDGESLHLRAALFSPDGAERIEGEARFAADDAAAPGRLAAELLDRATPGIAAHFNGPA